MDTQEYIHLPSTYITLFSAILLILPPCLSSTSLPVRYSITGYKPEDLRYENRMAEIFQQWRTKHGRIYKHADEMLERFEIFKRNMRYIVEKNSNRTGHMLGLNRFADLSKEEFKKKYFGKKKRPVRLSKSKRTSQSLIVACDAPVSLDWRKKGAVNPVKDQGSCGSCWAFSSTGAIEGINAINTGELINLSEQELVDCDTTDYGCDGGDMDYAFEWVIHNGGIDTEANYPYTGYDGICNATKKGKKVVSIEGYEDVEESDSALLCATVNQPLSIGIDGSSWDFQLYTGGIFDGDCSSNPDDIDHAALIVGYGSEGDTDYWIVKNSWGTYWGMVGYIYIKRNTNLPYGVCAINAEASYPTQTSSAPSPYPSPISPPPPPHPPYNPPPPSPSPSECGNFFYCPPSQTCCCLFEYFGFCFIHGCCEYTNAVCCTGTNYCCPRDYPICDVYEGMCLKNSRDYVGVGAKKKKLAKHKLRWSKGAESLELVTYQPLQWRRNRFAEE